MKANNEMYDFSEASISALFKGNVANGGNFIRFNEFLNDTGIAFESDFRFGDLFYFPNNGVYYDKLVELYKQKYISNIYNKLRTVEFDRTKIKENLDKIKQHIIKHSALITGVDKWTTQINNKNKKRRSEIVSYGGDNGHAVAIIGWDDDHINLSGSKGAFIVLNSDLPYENNDGTNFLSYDITLLYLDLYGYEYKANKFISSKGTGKVKNNYYRFYDQFYDIKNNLTNNIPRPLNENVFNWNDQVKMEYTFNNSIVNLKRFNAKIYLDQEDITDKFKINIKDNKLTVEPREKTLKPGSYTVRLNYKYQLKNSNDIKTDQEYRQIYILDGSEGLYTSSYWEYSEYNKNFPLKPL